MRARVIIADDHLLFIEGMRRVIESECEIVGTCSNGRDLVEIALRLLPEIVLLDIGMPLLSGMEAARQIKKAAPSVKVIFVTMQMNREYVREAFELGASGYLSKHSAASELTEAIAHVRMGRYAFSSALSDAVQGHATSSDQNPVTLFGALTPRQREVLQLVADGHSAKQIADLLSISIKTVEFHKKQLMSELRLQNSAELVRWAVEHGWVHS